MYRTACLRVRLILLISTGALGASAADPPKVKIHLVGDAQQLDDRVRITRARPFLAGALWFEPAQRVGSGFDATFTFQITKPGGLGRGADGFAFVLQNEGLAAMAGRGSAGGFALGDGHNDPNAPGIPHS